MVYRVKLLGYPLPCRWGVQFRETCFKCNSILKSNDRLLKENNYN